ncbi:MAG: hypothetical protein U0451_03705 [Candidatus Saccharimonadales bacterium]
MFNSLLQYFAAGCSVAQEQWFIPTWYKYLPGEKDPVTGVCSPMWGMQYDSSNIKVLLGIGLALGEILLRVVAVVAVGYIVYGGFQYLISQGEPDRTKKAKDSILNACVGLVIAIMANVIVVFIGRNLSK